MIDDNVKGRFEQESYTIFSALEKLLLTVIGKQNLDKSTLKLMEGNYTDEDYISILTTKMVISKQIFIDVNTVCFSGIASHLLTLKNNKIFLISNVMIVCNLLLVKPATSATPERSFSMVRRIKICNKLL